MWGHDIKVRKELSKRELHKLGLTDMEKIPLEDKTISYSKEDCKLEFDIKLFLRIIEIIYMIYILYRFEICNIIFNRLFARKENNAGIMGLL